MYKLYRRNFFKYTLQYISVGFLPCIACAVIWMYKDMIEQYVGIPEKLYRFIPLIIVALGLFTFIIYIFFPVVMFMVKNTNTSISALLKRTEMTEETAIVDFQRSEPMGKINFGDKCAYYKRKGVVNTIPYCDLAWIYIKVLTKTVTEVKGPSRIPVERLSTRENYILVINTIKGKSYQIPVYNKKYISDYEKQLFYTPGILIGFSEENKRKYKKIVNDSKSFKDKAS